MTATLNNALKEKSAMSVLVAACVFAAVSVLLSVLGIAMPLWLHKYTPGELASYRIGLWQTCVIHCYDIEIFLKVDEGIISTRALELCGCFLILGVLAALVVILLRKMSAAQRFLKIMGYVALFAGLLMIAGCVVFALKVREKHHLEEFNLHASFGLCIASAFFSLVAGTMLNLITEDETVAQQNVLNDFTRANSPSSVHM